MIRRFDGLRRQPETRPDVQHGYHRSPEIDDAFDDRRCLGQMRHAHRAEYFDDVRQRNAVTLVASLERQDLRQLQDGQPPIPASELPLTTGSRGAIRIIPLKAALSAYFWL